MWPFTKKKKQTPIVEASSESPRKERIPLNEVFRDEFGNVFYEYANPLELPSSRAVAAEVALRYAEMKLTRDEILRLTRRMKELANKGNIVELFTIINEIEFREDFIAEEKTLIELGTVYSVMNDEDESVFNATEQQRKQKEIMRSDATKAFFLRWAFGYTKQFSDFSDTDINAYFLERAADLNRLGRFMRRSTSTV